MANSYQGPANGTASYFFGATCGVETSITVGQPSLGPASAPYVDITGSFAGTPVNKTTVTGVLFVSPA